MDSVYIQYVMLIMIPEIFTSSVNNMILIYLLLNFDNKILIIDMLSICPVYLIMGSLGEGALTHLTIIFKISNQQSIISTGNGVLLSGLIGFVPQFELQGSRICWENLYLLVRDIRLFTHK